MRNIQVSTEVFAQIWAARRPPEESEDEILKRILANSEGVGFCGGAIDLGEAMPPIPEVETSDFRGEKVIGSHVASIEHKQMGKVRWVDDVRFALASLGGRASLHSIYREVTHIRRQAGRTVPVSIEATIRRTLEDHSSDSANFRGEDLFCLPEGHGKGIWALRENSKD